MDKPKVFETVSTWKQRTSDSIRVVAFGSSNTQLSLVHAGRFNWVTWLAVAMEAQIGHHVCVINRGIGGETTTDLLRRIERDVLSFKPEMVIVTIGGNDAAKGLAIDQYERQLSEVGQIIRSSGAEAVLQTYYCPLYECFNEGFDRHFEQFVQVNRDLAAKDAYPLIDQYNLFQPLRQADPTGYTALMRDGFHVNHLGNLLMARNALRCFQLEPVAVPAGWENDVEQLPAVIRQHF